MTDSDRWLVGMDIRVPARQVAKAMAALDASASTLFPAARAGSGAGVIQDGGKNGVLRRPGRGRQVTKLNLLAPTKW